MAKAKIPYTKRERRLRAELKRTSSYWSMAWGDRAAHEERLKLIDRLAGMAIKRLKMKQPDVVKSLLEAISAECNTERKKIND